MIIPTPTQQIDFQKYVNTVTEHIRRVVQLEQMLKTLNCEWYFDPLVSTLQAQSINQHPVFKERGAAY
jgi:hypothetical protein